MEEELFINGFCRVQNQGRTVTVVLEKENGNWEVTEVDCAYGKCEHQTVCEVAKQIDAWLASNNR